MYMTIETCMRLVDEMEPNGVPSEIKLRWLSEVEGKVKVELLGEDPAQVALLDTDTPVTTELEAPHPFDQLYWLYLVAMTDCMNGDVARYENAATLFNAAYQNFGRWLKRQGV